MKASTWKSDIESFTRTMDRRMRGVGSRLHSLSSKLEHGRARLLQDGEGQHSVHCENISHMMSVMGSALELEEAAPELAEPATIQSRNQSGFRSGRLSEIVERSIIRRRATAERPIIRRRATAERSTAKPSSCTTIPSSLDPRFVSACAA